MKEQYKKAVIDSVAIIREEIEHGKNASFIKDCIFYMLCESNIGISDFDYFDRYYFKVLMGCRISTYIKNMQMNFAIQIYENGTYKRIRQIDTFCNVSRFKGKYQLKKEGKEMKKYLITDLYNMEEQDLRWLTDEEENENMLIVEAKCKDEAIRKYLFGQCEFQPKIILKEMLFRDFWISIGYGDCEFVEEFAKSEEILRLADKIYVQYFEGQNVEAEELFLKCNTDEIINEYWKNLTPEDIKMAYYLCNRHDVFCLELRSLAKYKRMQRKNMQNIIEDIGEEDIRILNVLATMVRGERKEKYLLTKESFRGVGFTEEEAGILIKYCCTAKLRNVVKMIYEDGSFVVISLFDRTVKCFDDVDESIEIYPAELFYKFAEENYDFHDGKSDLATRLITEQTIAIS